MDGCKEICQRQTEMEIARRPMFQQELEELRSKVRIIVSNALGAISAGVEMSIIHDLLFLPISTIESGVS